MDFAIWGGATNSQAGVIFLLIDENNSWNSIRVSYLASARTDFLLGSFSAGTYFLQSASSSGVITYAHQIAGWTAQTNYNIIV